MKKTLLIFLGLLLAVTTSSCSFKLFPPSRVAVLSETEVIPPTNATVFSEQAEQTPDPVEEENSEAEDTPAIPSETEEQASPVEDENSETEDTSAIPSETEEDDEGTPDPYENGEETVADPKKATVSQTEDDTETGQNGYRIGNGDVLEIITWKEPDFSKEIAVRIDGKITFPLLDDIQAGGLSPLQLKKKIEEKLKEYVTDPRVTVSVKSPQSQKFYILGEVSKTGEYDLLKSLTVLQAFALAGGFTEWASKKEIILVRHEDGKERIIRINYKNIAKGKDFSQNILIKADDTIIVP